LQIYFNLVNKININTANVNILKHIHDVGDARTQQIINNRPYRDRDDVINKLDGLIPSVAIHNIIESVEY
jgi:DNA uptake protein ComE-like DNA-binding protein